MKQTEESIISTLKYVDTKIVFQEIPDEISLAFNISGCPVHCPDCHSKYLWEDIGKPLSISNVLHEYHHSYPDVITCILFMGGDNDPEYLREIATIVKKVTNCKIAWYSGRNFDIWHYLAKGACFDYVKTGSFDITRGGLNKETTNQRLYKLLSTKEGIQQPYDLTSRMYSKP